MSRGSFDASLSWLATADYRSLLSAGLRGLEKECLRVGPDGTLSDEPHSRRFGSALTHPWLTTDYSEVLLEFVTPPYPSSAEALDCLTDLHAFVTQRSPDYLWPSSMPCVMEANESLPIAEYGPSNEGRLRSVYRSGLGYRYGRAMQAIAGTHFNYSLPAAFWPEYREHRGARQQNGEFRSACLMGLVRNFRRVGWLLTYLFGASPAFCKSFRPAGHPRLESFSEDTWYAPYSTSLRMSDMGYRNSTQARLSISADSLDTYLGELRRALTTPEPRYEAIGVHVDGEFRQLNANVLQLENEYYTSIRPKPARKEPRLISAMQANGVEYVEVRTLDINPFSAPGLTGAQADIVELLLIHCLLSDSPPISDAEQAEIDRRELVVAWDGRQPGLELERAGRNVALAAWAGEIVERLAALATLLDDEQSRYSRAIDGIREAVRDPAATLSAEVLDALQGSGRSFAGWAFGIARRRREAWLAHEFAPGRLESLDRAAADSLAAAERLENLEQPPFESFLEEFLAQGIEADFGSRRRIL